MLWSLFYLFVIVVHDVIEPRWEQGSQGLDVVGCYLSSDDLTNTSSHKCGSWYLPIFLLRDGSLSLISISSLMDLAILWSPLPTMLKFSMERSWPVVLWWSRMGEGALVFYEPFCKSSTSFPNIIFFTDKTELFQKVQRTHEGPLTHPWPLQHHWSWPFYWKLLHCGQGGPKYCQIHQRRNTNQRQGPIPK